MIDLELLRKFVLEFLPADAQAPFQDCFEALKAEPKLILNNALFFQKSYYQNPDRKLAVAGANGVLTGIALCYAMDKFPEVHRMLQSYLEEARRSRGENVIKFFDRKEL